jgi:hypothetical protein
LEGSTPPSRTILRSSDGISARDPFDNRSPRSRTALARQRHVQLLLGFVLFPSQVADLALSAFGPLAARSPGSAFTEPSYTRRGGSEKLKSVSLSARAGSSILRLLGAGATFVEDRSHGRASRGIAPSFTSIVES